MPKLEKKDLNKGWLFWQMFTLSSCSYEKLESSGFAFSMIPIARKLYGEGTEEFQQCIERHTAFYNTEPQTGSIVNGIIASLEEENANGTGIDDDVMHSIKTALMGPIAGIGDSTVQGIFIPLLLSIAMGLSADGSIIGVMFYVIAYNGIMLSLSRFLYGKGYVLGTGAVDYIKSDSITRLKNAFNVLGMVVVGGLASSFVRLSTVLEIYNDVTKTTFVVQDSLDGFFPGLLGVIAVMVCYYLISKKNISSNRVLLILIAFAIVGVMIGVI
jgi:mannose/fructose/N-acetylgalactosamine-specific phosphotransferase system component IID